MKKEIGKATLELGEYTNQGSIRHAILDIKLKDKSKSSPTLAV